MTAPLSPDEGVRAALPTADVMRAALREYGAGDNVAGEAETLGRHTAVRGLMARLGLYAEFSKLLEADATDDEIGAALSTPVPEEGLPRGSASAAECITDAMVEAACRGYWPSHWPQQFASTDADSIRGHMRQALARALVSAEAGDGVASALPSPLPSQGEPVAWVGRKSLEGLKDGSCQSAVIRPLCTDIFAVSVPLYTAEALAAAEARADRAEEALRDAARDFDSLAISIRNDASSQAAVDADAAALRARTILKETAHDER